MKDVVEALIEIPLHSKNKYEMDPKTKKIRLDRVVYASMVYPAEYGIIENTLAPDGDALDILVISDNPTFPGCYVPARVLGYLEMVDNGQIDYKLISVVACDPIYAEYKGLADLPHFILKEIKNFFDNYKVLQNIEVKTGRYHGKEDAMKIIEECRERYAKSQSE
ncbi:MAG: inorganic diphosphatase [Lachnospiraceae bacterium]|nr:inorganic diphosphatase [Lachnospiraceae bacterium]